MCARTSERGGGNRAGVALCGCIDFVVLCMILCCWAGGQTDGGSPGLAYGEWERGRDLCCTGSWEEERIKNKKWKNLRHSSTVLEWKGDNRVRYGVQLGLWLRNEFIVRGVKMNEYSSCGLEVLGISACLG